MLPRLVLNSWSQVILLPWPPKMLGLQMRKLNHVKVKKQLSVSQLHCSLLPPYEEGRVCFPFLHDCKFPEASPAMLNCHITRTRDPLNGEAKRAVTQTSLKHVPCLPGCGRRKGEKSCGPSGIPDLGAPQARAVIPSLGSCGSWHLQDSRL
ncbi:uncharacterized protein [Symphalangus syndactylus]|uniref:uncharacterized protein isoform X2 n=1 Tax=Symphalangus syndactylus TaxID=9590 RepID=UPI003003EEAA